MSQLWFGIPHGHKDISGVRKFLDYDNRSISVHTSQFSKLDTSNVYYPVYQLYLDGTVQIGGTKA